MEETGEEGVGAVQVSKVRRKEGPMCFRERENGGKFNKLIELRGHHEHGPTESAFDLTLHG